MKEIIKDLKIKLPFNGKAPPSFGFNHICFLIIAFMFLLSFV